MMEAPHLISTVRTGSVPLVSAQTRDCLPNANCQEVCVIRAELRKVFAVLEAEGQIQRHVARGRSPSIHLRIPSQR